MIGFVSVIDIRRQFIIDVLVNGDAGSAVYMLFLFIVPFLVYTFIFASIIYLIVRGIISTKAARFNVKGLDS